MPCIQTKVSVGLSKEKEQVLKEKFGKAISLLPGKSEGWLMLDFEDNCRMWFRGENDAPAAFLQVQVYGTANGGAFDKLTGELTGILQSELNISPDHIYISYAATPHWGWNGGNF